MRIPSDAHAERNPVMAQALFSSETLKEYSGTLQQTCPFAGMLISSIVLKALYTKVGLTQVPAEIAWNRPEGVGLPGQLKSLVLKNFMCHEHLKMIFGYRSSPTITSMILPLYSCVPKDAPHRQQILDLTAWQLNTIVLCISAMNSHQGICRLCSKTFAI